MRAPQLQLQQPVPVQVQVQQQQVQQKQTATPEYISQLAIRKIGFLNNSLKICVSEN